LLKMKLEIEDTDLYKYNLLSGYFVDEWL
jgi:hypothetical protein